MKIFLLFSALVSSIAFGQVQTSTGDGNFFNPLLWDCFCVPASGDSLVIQHDMIMTASIYYTSGQIKIDYTGSLVEDGTNRDVWVDGGSLLNFGVFDCYRLYISNGSFQNFGTSVYFDSLWNQASLLNDGVITAYDFLNDQTGSFNNSTISDLNITHDFMNQGYVFNNGNIDVTNNFSNCNIQTMDAEFYNHGVFCIGQDFINCLDDTLAGTGEYFVGDESANLGVFDGTFDFNTPTGSLTSNTGTIDGAVTLGNAPCYLSIEENSLSFNIYPNPVNAILFVNGGTNFSYQIFDLAGKLVISNSTQNGQIDVSAITAGIYTISLVSTNGNSSTEKFVKQ